MSWFTKDGRRHKRNVIRRHAKPETKAFAKRARHNLTPSEQLVWNRLHSLNLRFRRQSVILGWIADFYHPKSKLVIEIDGGYHHTPEQQQKDRLRDEVMRRRGLRVIRIPAALVFADLDYVITKIVRATRLESPRSQPEGSPVGAGSGPRPAARNESRSGSPTAPSARPSRSKTAGSGVAVSGVSLNRQASEYPGQTGA